MYQTIEITENVSEIKEENIDTVLKVAEKTIGYDLSSTTPVDNMDVSIQIPERWFKPKESENESVKPMAKRKRKLS